MRVTCRALLFGVVLMGVVVPAVLVIASYAASIGAAGLLVAGILSLVGDLAYKYWMNTAGTYVPIVRPERCRASAARRRPDAPRGPSPRGAPNTRRASPSGARTLERCGAQPRRSDKTAEAMMGKVGFLGIGTMGSRMSARLLAAGHEVTVWNRTVEKTAPLARRAPPSRPLPRKPLRARTSCSPTSPTARRSECHHRPGRRAGGRPAAADLRRHGHHRSGRVGRDRGAARSRGVGFLRAPVSGTANVAEAGKLTIMTSGDKAVYDAADPYLAALGETRYYVGTGEKSRFLKLIHQMMIAATMQVWAEGLVMGEKAGLDWRPDAGGPGQQRRGFGGGQGQDPHAGQRSYDNPAMSLHNIVKDLDLALAAGGEVGVELPATKWVRELYEPGHGRRFRVERLLRRSSSRWRRGRGWSPRRRLVTEAAVGTSTRRRTLFWSSPPMARTRPSSTRAPTPILCRRPGRGGRSVGLESPKPILCTHEFTAVSAAHGYYLVTGRPQTRACACGRRHRQRGRGAEQRRRARRPAWCLRRQDPVHLRWRDARRPGQLHHVEPGPVRSGRSRPRRTSSGTTNWAGRRTGDVVARAFQVAANEPAGPVYLTLPREVLMLPAPAVRMPDRWMTRRRRRRRPTRTRSGGRRDAACAERPLIVAGRNGRKPASIPDWRDWQSFWGPRSATPTSTRACPGATRSTSGPHWRLCFPPPTPCSSWRAGCPTCPAQPSPRRTRRSSISTAILCTRANVTWEYPADLRITADSVDRSAGPSPGRRRLRTPAQAERTPKGGHASPARRKWVEGGGPGRGRARTHPIHPEWVAWCLKQVLPETRSFWRTPSPTASGQNPSDARRAGDALHLRRCLPGVGVNAAIGCKLGRPDRMVVSLVGDGGFTFANPLAALWTASAREPPASR